MRRRRSGTLRAAARRFAVLLAVLVVAFPVAAQVGLEVNAIRVPGATTTLVPGTTYAPAAELAVAAGFTWAADRAAANITFTLGGRIATLSVVDDPGAAARSGALTVDGRPAGDLAGVRSGFEVFVPVAPLIRAFGGAVEYLGPDPGVVAVLPRAEATASRYRRGPPETVAVRLDAPVPVSTFRDDALGTLTVRIERATLRRARTFEGDGIIRADLVPRDGGIDLRVQLERGLRADVVELPDGDGFELAVLVTPAAELERAAVDEPAGPQVVLEPWSPPGDAGRTRVFVERLAERLDALGVPVVTTLDARGDPLAPAARSRRAAGADLFVSVHVGEVPAGQYRIYYLGDAERVEALDAAVRRNAAAALAGETTEDDPTAALRREVLLGLVPDLAVGRRFAETLRRELLLLGGYTSDAAVAAPLVPLADAAGRGVLLEFAPVDLAGERLVGDLARAIASLLGGSLP